VKSGWGIVHNVKAQRRGSSVSAGAPGSISDFEIVILSPLNQQRGVLSEYVLPLENTGSEKVLSNSLMSRIFWLLSENVMHIFLPEGVTSSLVGLGVCSLRPAYSLILACHVSYCLSTALSTSASRPTAQAH